MAAPNGGLLGLVGFYFNFYNFHFSFVNICVRHILSACVIFFMGRLSKSLLSYLGSCKIEG